MLRRSEHVALHKVVVAAELVEIHAGGSDHPNMSVREAAAQYEGHLFQTPLEPLGSIRLQNHLLLEVLHTMEHNRTLKDAEHKVTQEVTSSQPSNTFYLEKGQSILMNVCM